MKISVTMQFRDELEFMEGFFQSAMSYADEIICGAHFSKDGSLEYVRNLQKQSSIPIHVVEFPEDTIVRHGFSYMKNELAKMAKGDWIISLDADEEMAISKESLRPFTFGSHLVISTKTVNLIKSRSEWTLNDRAVIRNEASTKSERHWRIFRNNNSIRWKGLIHEELHLPSGTHVSANCRQSPLKMYHFGKFADPNKQNDKWGLYSELLLRIIDYPELRDGTHHYWWTVYYVENQDKLEAKRAEFRKNNPHLFG